MSRKATIRESYEWLCECVRCTTESSVGKFLPWRTLNDHYLKSFRNSSTRVGPDDSASAPQTWFDKRKEDLDMLALNQRTELRTAVREPSTWLLPIFRFLCSLSMLSWLAFTTNERACKDPTTASSGRKATLSPFFLFHSFDPLISTRQLIYPSGRLFDNRYTSNLRTQC